MQPPTDKDIKSLLTEVIKKEIIILGPYITLAKARNVTGLTVTDDGTVTDVKGNPQEVTQKLVEQFMELSGLIVKKTMEPLLAGFDGVDEKAAATGVATATPPNTPAPAQPAIPSTPSTTPPTQPGMQTVTPPTQPTPTQPAATPPTGGKTA